MALSIPLRRKYREQPRPKSVKNTKAGNGKKAGDASKVSWKKGTGEGDRRRSGAKK